MIFSTSNNALYTVFFSFDQMNMFNCQLSIELCVMAQ